MTDLREDAVLFSVDAYERSRKERELLELLAASEQEIAAGRGHSLNSVLQDVDELLSAG